MGHQLDEKYLHFYGKAVDGAVLFGAVQVVQAGFYHIGRLIQPVKILHLAVGIALKGMAEKLGFYPAGVHGHDPDALFFQLPVHGTAVAEDKGLGGAVGGDVRHRLESGQTVQLQNVAAGLHIGNAQPRHHQQSLAVQVDHAAVFFNRGLVTGAEFSKARGVDKKPDVRLLCFQQHADFVAAFFFQ